MEAGPQIFGMFKKKLRRYAATALASSGVEVSTGEVVESVSQTRVTLKSGAVIPAHTLVWGAGAARERARRIARSRVQHGNRIPTEPDLSLAGHPEVFLRSATLPGSSRAEDGRKERSCRSSGRSPCKSGEQAAGRALSRRQGDRAVPPTWTRARWRRSDAARPWSSCPADARLRARAATLAWGSVHLALLSTGEDRAKAIVDSTWAGFAHDRPARITVRTDERDAG